MAGERIGIDGRNVCACIARRYQIAIILCIGYFIVRGMRSNLPSTSEYSTVVEWHPIGEVMPPFVWPYEPKQWSFYLFLCAESMTTIIGGFLTLKLPANRMFGLAVAVSSLLQLFLPAAISVGPALVIAIYVFKGLFEGLMLPTCIAMLGFWAPPLENTCLTAIPLFGLHLGQYTGYQITVWLTHSTNNWSACFYAYGAIGVVWSALWFWLSSENPSHDRSISLMKIDHIQSSFGPTESNAIGARKIPWKSFLKSLPLLSILVVGFCCGWNSLLVQFLIPKSRSAMYATLYTMTAAILVVGMISDYLRLRCYCFSNLIRKLTISTGLFAISAVLLFIVFYDFQHWLFYSIISVVLCVLHITVVTGFIVNHLDIAQRYAALLIGISSGLEALALLTHGFIRVAVMKDGFFFSNADDVIQTFTRLLMVTAAINFIGGLFCFVFASGKLQSWAKPLTPSVEVERISEHTL